MKFTRTAGGASGPSSSIGIMRFFDSDTGGPPISPEFVMIIGVILVVVVLAIHVMG